MAPELPDRIAQRAFELGTSIPGSLAAALATYLQLLARWNRSVNLTSLRVESRGPEAIDRLVIEPVAAAQFVDPSAALWLDLGSGGGSPAIPLKLFYPHVPLVMVESRAKKVAFLREAVRVLELQGAQVEHARLESLALEPRWRSAAELITARAVRPDAVFARAAGALLRPGGALLLIGANRAEPVEFVNFGQGVRHALLQGSSITIYKRLS